MDLFIGLDVSVRETSVGVVDESGKILKEAKVPTEPEAIASLIAKGGYACKRVGLGPGQCRSGSTRAWRKRGCR